ncbi:MAG: FadR/GntR family transcriptional regulator [Bacillota bacterium]
MNIHFATIKTKKIYEEVVDQILALISAGDLKPGQQLPPERELAQRLGVSRPSMREAFSILEMFGVVEIRPGDGTYVAHRVPPSLLSPVAHALMRTKKEILESYEVRSVLAIEAARLAAERATPEDLVELQEIHHSLSRSLTSGQTSDDGDTTLHKTIARLTHNDVFYQLLEDIQYILVKINRVFYQALRAGATGEGQIEQSVAELDRLVKAIVNHDPEGAAAAMRAHLDNVKPIIMAGISEEDAGQ